MSLRQWRLSEIPGSKGNRKVMAVEWRKYYNFFKERRYYNIFPAIGKAYGGMSLIKQRT